MSLSVEDQTDILIKIDELNNIIRQVMLELLQLDFSEDEYKELTLLMKEANIARVSLKNSYKKTLNYRLNE